MMYEFINILKGLASLLITNSHFEKVYPNSLSVLAFGGSYGNALFFIISGFLIGDCRRPFKEWLVLKLLRIYIPVWIVTSIIYIIEGLQTVSFGTMVLSFFYPTQFWFVNVIVVFYCLGYIVQKYLSDKIDYVLIFLSILYVIVLYGMLDYRSLDIDHK